MIPLDEGSGGGKVIPPTATKMRGGILVQKYAWERVVKLLGVDSMELVGQGAAIFAGEMPVRWGSMEPWEVEVPSLRGRAGATPELSWGVRGRMKIPLSLLEGRAEQSGAGKVKVGSAKTSIRLIDGAAA